MIKGTHLTVKFNRVVDGDTIRVYLPNDDQDESLRILALDTEESNSGSSKPVTPWGKQAKQRAQHFFEDADEVIIEFPGNEDLATCLIKYRGNFGRLLVYVYHKGVDFQETMIREGYSPYFMKYGNAEFTSHHLRYQRAEREAQRQHLGVWDQITVNGVTHRNYAALTTWWQLRASIIDGYRSIRAIDSSVLNTRLDYINLVAQAQTGERVTVFTELRSHTRVGGRHGLIGIGSIQQPFNLFIPNIDSETGQEILNLLESRYLSHGDDQPGRSYAYVSGVLSTFNGQPQLVVTSADQISDSLDNRMDLMPQVAVRITSLLPNPAGADAGFERLNLRNTGSLKVSLEGWFLQDHAGSRAALHGDIEPGETAEIQLQPREMPLNNTGDAITLMDGNGKIMNAVSYRASDVVSGQLILFA
ncbi:MAG: thermonuclease family protein [Gammaproteobacteria bacterium]|nr:thermonuclease family protein [Gammaproteobacteria bacterium]